MQIPSDALIWLIVGGASVIGSIWRNAREGKAQSEAQRQRKAAASAPPKPGPDLTPSTADQRYRQVQEEIRRRIAERMRPSAGPLTPTATGPFAPARPRRPLAQSVPPPSAPPVVVVAPIPSGYADEVRENLQETAKRLAKVETRRRADALAEDHSRVAAAYAQAPAAGLSTADAYAQAPTEEVSTMAAAYAQAPGGVASAPGASMRAMLAAPSAARRAFLLRELLGAPVGERASLSGGHEAW
jgi:hypothetical protein